jgi:hypothetical protein
VIPTLFLRALTEPDACRPAVLEAFLRDRGVAAARIALAGSLHLAVKFPESSYDPRYRTKMLVAHHDRRPGSSGALDNGAACLQLADLAGRLVSREEPHNTVILFTDSEESSVAGDQGSFAVARALAGRVRTLAGEGAEPPAVFVFDVTGRGTVPILSTTARDLLASRGPDYGDLAGRIGDLESWASRALRRSSGAAPLRLPVPWSDDLGFALGGIPAVTVTLLPRSELGGRNDSARRKRPDGAELPHGEYPEKPPATWALLHGPGDRPDCLEEESFDLMARILDAFGNLRIPKVRRIR